MPSPTQRVGAQAEAHAAAFLEAAGFQIVMRNFLRRAGELDLVARREGLLVIAEVRTRAGARYGGAAASVVGRKQRRIVRAAQQLLQRNAALARLPVRFDVLVVHDPGLPSMRVEWIPHAFEA